MALNHLTKENCTKITGGDPKRILLAALRTGLGTSVHALPAISQLISDGYEVTVNCKDFQRAIYEAIGCKTICIREPFGLSWFQEHGNEYGKIVSLATWDQWQQWQYGFNTTSTMEAFAQILDVSLPEEFSWINILCEGEDYIEDNYILFTPNATERWRSLPKEIADTIELELKKIGKVIRLNGDECQTWEQLRYYINNASHIVTVENGISNVAGALGKSMLVLVGMTEVETTIEQYRKYIPNLNYRIVKGFQPEGCLMPCMRQKDRGFINDKCLGKNELPECLSKLDVSEVVQEFTLLIG